MISADEAVNTLVYMSKHDREVYTNTRSYVLASKEYKTKWTNPSVEFKLDSQPKQYKRTSKH